MSALTGPGFDPRQLHFYFTPGSAYNFNILRLCIKWFFHFIIPDCWIIHFDQVTQVVQTRYATGFSLGFIYRPQCGKHLGIHYLCARMKIFIRSLTKI